MRLEYTYYTHIQTYIIYMHTALDVAARARAVEFQLEAQEEKDCRRFLIWNLPTDSPDVWRLFRVWPFTFCSLPYTTATTLL